MLKSVGRIYCQLITGWVYFLSHRVSENEFMLQIIMDQDQNTGVPAAKPVVPNEVEETVAPAMPEAPEEQAAA
ncbi:MAG: hypothetical protein ACYCPH_02260 [Minisyncoccota bacterium]